MGRYAYAAAAALCLEKDHLACPRLLLVIAVIAVLVGLLEDMIERRKKGEPF
jgi:hypothetical protein